jgi:hypothetical protein
MQPLVFPPQEEFLSDWIDHTPTTITATSSQVTETCFDIDTNFVDPSDLTKATAAKQRGLLLNPPPSLYQQLESVSKMPLTDINIVAARMGIYNPVSAIYGNFR